MLQSAGRDAAGFSLPARQRSKPETTLHVLLGALLPARLTDRLTDTHKSASWPHMVGLGF
jgi:hypothetical protein